MRTILLAMLLSFSSLAISDEDQTIGLWNNALKINVPSSVILKTDTANQAVLVNQSGLAKFNFNLTDTPVDQITIKDIHKQISAIYQEQFSDAKWKKDKVVSLYGTRVFLLEFETSSVSSKTYQLIYGIPVNGQLVIASFFSAEDKYKKRWQKIAREVFESLEITQTVTE